jgi:ribonuclease HII
MLAAGYTGLKFEAGCDEAGRGCLMGPVFAAAVILTPDFFNEEINDSKKLTAKKRDSLRIIIEREAVAWAVASVPEDEIDRMNILNASILAMHKALDQLTPPPEYILVDGNRFKPYKNISHRSFVKGDGLFLSIAAASILAKTHRDSFVEQLHMEYPDYGWLQNKGYGTAAHIKAIENHGLTPYHRKSFSLKKQLSLGF